MFTNNGPIAAANKLQEYLIFNVAAAPADVQPKLLEVARDRSPADILVKGSELLYTALTEFAMPNAATAWEAVGVAALQVAHSNLWGRSERGFAVMTYANFKVNGATAGMGEPEAPPVDNEYRITPPAPSGPPPGFVPPTPGPA